MPPKPHRSTPPARPGTAASGAAVAERRAAVPQPRVWTFDGPFERCLAELEDTLRRAIVGVGDVSRIALRIELSLPALRQRVAAGEAVQPAWGRFVERLAAYGPPGAARLRHSRNPGPLATLVLAYRR
jgi:hypothetical protein